MDAVRIATLAGQLRLAGHPVLEQAWDDSLHVAHVVAHPDQYASCIRCDDGRLLRAMWGEGLS